VNEGRKQLLRRFGSWQNYSCQIDTWSFFDYKRIPADEMTGIMAMDDELSSWLWPLTLYNDGLYGSLN